MLDEHDEWLHLAYVEGNVQAACFYERVGFEYVTSEPDTDGWPGQVWLRLRVSHLMRREPSLGETAPR